ncbi:MAG: hypothetical protein JWO83_5033 [Caulobacteraceae bacterium]|jgi:hypothetical protein|nr:hypothetical protein [Caulobacteraceae bacterium]
MFRTLAIAAFAASFVAASALPAAADTTVKVDVAGLSATAAKAKIFKAAKAACRVELRDATSFEQYYQWSGCINDAVANAQSQLKTTTASASSSVAGGR